MNGYVKNKTSMWKHAMKRSIGPGAEVPLDELYDQYGVKHDIKEGSDFVSWLRNVKLKDTNQWEIKLITEEDIKQAEAAAKEEQEKPKPKAIDRVAPLVPKAMEIADIVSLSVRKGREVLPHIQDLKLLKYALQEANQLSGKDSLCRLIRKRIQDLQIAR